MADIFFTSPEHKRRWLTAILAIGKVYAGKLDPEYGAAVYILTADSDTWDQASEYVDRDGIDFEALLAEVDFSGAYSNLIRLAGNLFNGTIHVDPVELYRLDDTNFLIALTALQVRRHALPVSEAELYNAKIDERTRIILENRDKPWLPLHDGE